MKAAAFFLFTSLVFPHAYSDPLKWDKFPFAVIPWSGLEFGESLTGDAEKHVPAAGFETIDNASFMVLGRPFSEFAVFIPSEIYIYHQDRGRFDRIRIKQIRSIPKTTLQIGALGLGKVYIGATREIIRNNQREGSYTGDLVLTIIQH